MKSFISVIIFLFFMPLTAQASISGILSRNLRSDDGLFFACTANFESGARLLTASERDGGIALCAYDDSDGDAMDDELYFSDAASPLRLSLIRSGELEYLLLTGGEKSCFTLLDDTFYSAAVPENYTVVTGIAALRRGRLDTLGNTRGAAYNLVNQMKCDKKYGFINRINSAGSEAYELLHRHIAACADIMRYDCHEQDTDTLMRYILNTNANFKIVCAVEPKRGGSDIRLVNAEYIDDIARRIFGIEPPKPYVNELITKGYCYDNGYYSYIPAFNTNFSTAVLDLFAIYDLGGNVYFVTFGDIYTENGTAVPEISYAIFEKNGAQLRLLRLGMGGNLPDEHELLQYSSGGKYTKFAWEEKKELAKSGGLWYNVCAFWEKLLNFDLWVRLAAVHKGSPSGGAGMAVRHD